MNDGNELNVSAAVEAAEALTRRRRGRPTLFDEAKAEAIVIATRTGNYREVAAASAGVSKSTLLSWLKRGAKGEAPFTTFAQQVNEAEAEAEMAALAVIKAAGKTGTWQASAWYLERVHPDRYARHTSVDVTRSLRDDVARVARKFHLDEVELMTEAERVYRLLSDDE